MTGRRISRMRSVLKVAKRNEQAAQRNAAGLAADVASASGHAEQSQDRSDEISAQEPATTSELVRHRERAARAVAHDRKAQTDLAELLDEQLIARNELLGAMRRRRSVEELQGRQLAMQASLAARAAQKSLDELAAMRRGERR